MSTRNLTSSETPRQLFFNSPEQRTALARQKFFEEGERPSGLVSEPVIQSWMRCYRAHHQPDKPVAFDEVSHSRVHAVLNRSRQLLQAADHELSSMETALAGIGCRVLLTDGQGVIVHSSAHPLSAPQRLLQVVSRVGINLAEGRVGTTAPGIAIHSGQACSVVGAEHFFDCLAEFRCAAAPIRDVQGEIAGVLDVTIATGRFDFDAASVVELCATAIENRLLQAQSQEHVVLQFQAHPSLLGTPLEALVGVTGNGQVAWLNRVARRLTGVDSAEVSSAHQLLGLDLPALLRLCRQTSPQTLRLPNGLGVWVRGQLRAPDGADFRHAVSLPSTPVIAPPEATPTTPEPTAPAPEAPSALMAPPSAPSLDTHTRQLIENTLRDCGHNIAQAARQLGVSRGTLYRHLKRSASNTQATPPAD